MSDVEYSDFQVQEVERLHRRKLNISITRTVLGYGLIIFALLSFVRADDASIVLGVMVGLAGLGTLSGYTPRLLRQPRDVPYIPPNATPSYAKSLRALAQRGASDTIVSPALTRLRRNLTILSLIRSLGFVGVLMLVAFAQWQERRAYIDRYGTSGPVTIRIDADGNEVITPFVAPTAMPPSYIGPNRSTPQVTLPDDG